MTASQIKGLRRRFHTISVLPTGNILCSNLVLHQPSYIKNKKMKLKKLREKIKKKNKGKNQGKKNKKNH